MKKKLALLLAIILTLGQFSIITADGLSVSFDASTTSEANVLYGPNIPVTIPQSLQPGEVWTGKSVAYSRSDMTATITLYAWAQHYSVENQSMLPLCENNQYVTIVDGLGEFSFDTSAGAYPGTLTHQAASNTVTWEIHQNEIVGAAPASISYTIHLNEPNDGWEIGLWYWSGTSTYRFSPARGNPFYWTKEETTQNAFTTSMNWNNGNGLNSGTITDNELGITINFGGNSIPAGQTAAQTAPDRWNTDARVGSNTYLWHLHWMSTNQPKTYTFTVRDLGGLGINIAYEIIFPNPGGNQSFPGGRTLTSVEYFQRHFQANNPSNTFFWPEDGVIEGTLLEPRAQIQIPPPPGWQTGTLVVNKVLEGAYETDWGIGYDTVFNAILWLQTGPATIEYLTFSPGAGNHEYVFTGFVDERERATEINFSRRSPATLTGLWVYQCDNITPAIYFIEEVFDNSTRPYLAITYPYVDDKGFAISTEVTEITIVNDYRHGVGRLEVRKLLDGFGLDHGVDIHNVFHIRVWDVTGGYYLLFECLENSNFRHVGNQKDGLTKKLDGEPIMEVPIRPDTSAFLENLAFGSYEIHEVRLTSLGWERVPEITNQTQYNWDTNPEWTWGVTYTNNNVTLDRFNFNQTPRVDVRNNFKYASGNLTIRKALTGEFADWNVGRDTLFSARVWSVGESSRNQLVFERVVATDESVYFRFIGYIADGDIENGVTFYHKDYENIHYTDQVEFSQGALALIVNLPAGDNKYYFVEEIFPATKYRGHITTSYYFNNQPDEIYDTGIFFNSPMYSSLAVTINNHYAPTPEEYMMIISKVLAGHPADHGADINTKFLANVFHPATSPSALHFVLQEDGRYRYVPEYDVEATEGAATDIPFSAAAPAILVGLDPLVDYYVLEVDPGTGENGFEADIKINRPDKWLDTEYVGGNTLVTITNTFAALPRYTATYFANDDTDAYFADSIRYLAGATKVVLESSFVKDGYAFISWNRNADGSGDAFQPSDTFTKPAADTFLYAQWEPLENDPPTDEPTEDEYIYIVRHFIEWPDGDRDYIYTATNYIPGELRQNFTPNPTPFVPLAGGFAPLSGLGSVLPGIATPTLVGFDTNVQALDTPDHEIPWYWIDALLEKPDVVASMEYILNRFSEYGIEFSHTCIESPIKTDEGDELHKIYILEHEPDEPTDDEPTDDTPTDTPTDDDPTDDTPTEYPPTPPVYDPPTEPHVVPGQPHGYSHDYTHAPLLPLVPRGQTAPLPAPPSAGNLPTNAPPPGEFFIDEHIWFVRGDSQNNMRPNAYTSRADIAIVFYRLLRPEWKAFEPQGTPFNDVTGDEWFGRAVGILAHYGIVEGYHDGSFRPHEPITRKEFAAVVSRFDNLEETNVNPYTDLDPNDWAYRYILSATARGWFVGHDGRFRPDANLTRAEMVTAINRILRRRILLADIPPNVHRFYDLNESHWAYADIMEAAHTHTYVRNADGTTEIWIDILGTGLDAPFNE